MSYSISTAFTMILANGPEIIGTLTGIAGALMLATKSRFAPWAWPVWMVSNLAWIYWAVSISAYGALTQQMVFLVINCIGAWQWFYSVTPQPLSAGDIESTKVTTSPETSETANKSEEARFLGLV